jgi:(1->4)-alpha-D-glucan 1-alpha-D-glucosylmutase
MPTEIPRATYRLQLTASFGFNEAAELVPYLKALGISHLYASPFLKARKGSTHGYDIVDHGHLNPEFGGEPGFDRLSDALAAADMGLILDFVPNHMGVGYSDNAWWLDVLEWGPKSPHAASFDIDWETLPYRRGGGLLIPILGRPYGEALEQGEITLKYDAEEGSFSAWYFDHRLPIGPDRYDDIVRTTVASGEAEDTEAGRSLLKIAARYRDPGSPKREEAPELKRALAQVPGGADVINRGLRAYNDNGQAARTLLHRLLERQHYRIAHWRVAISEVNYRRFFDINDLAGIRVEHPQTFRDVHRLTFDLIKSGRLHGLRLDHIDGLSDPIQYCARLRKLVRTPERRTYLVVEKILAENEPMPRLPGVSGTTGYDVLNLITRVLLDDSGLPELDGMLHGIAPKAADFHGILKPAKMRALDNMLASEFTVLSRQLARIAAGHFPSRDYTSDRLRAAFQSYIVNFPRYRTYISRGKVSAEDRQIISNAIEAARAEWFGPDAGIFDFLRDALTLDLVAPGRVGYSKARVSRFAGKVQQLTGPVMAKSMEDTAFYRYHRLLALNEVGNEPDLGGLDLGEFHSRMAARAISQPHSMVATATHDTKRGEDARMRILALAELASDWGAAVERWMAINEKLTAGGPPRAPSRAHEYMLYQALVGSWPEEGEGRDFVERMQAYAVKAAREGKQETSWANPNQAYEEGLTGFIQRILDPARSSEFIRDFEEFVRRPALIGALNGLSQTVLKATLPGIPDFYQGTEFWDQSLVDPDNRRPVDFAARASALAKLTQAPDWNALIAKHSEGGIKLALIHRLLKLRAEFPNVFVNGRYEQVETTGPHRDHIIAFARIGRRNAVVVAVGRHMGQLTSQGRNWPRGAQWDAALNLDRFNVLEDSIRREPFRADSLSAAKLFEAMPVAVLRGTVRR